MNYSWPLFVAYAVAAFGVLKGLTVTSFPNLFVNVGLCLLAAIIADTLVKLMVNTLPRRLLPDLHNKAVLVTGCDTGFGHLCAKKLHDLGLTVFAGCLLPDGPGATELRTSTSDRLHVVALDVTKDDQVDGAVKFVEEHLCGKELHAVINNAGIAVIGEVDWCPVEFLQQVMDVNTVGVVRVTKAFLPMIKQSKGRIVCLSSLAGRVTTFAISYYSMSKCAVQNFVNGLRREMKKWSVTVHGIEPNAYVTNITSSKNIVNVFSTIWERCPKDTQSAYGKKYIDSCEKFLNSSKDILASHRVHDVVDDMVDAAVGLTPKLRYVPGFLHQLLPRLCVLLPTELQDYALEINLTPKAKPAALTASKK